MEYEIFPLGIKWWAQFDTTKKPHYTVYECLGRVGRSELYWFKARKDDPTLFIKSMEELNKNGFRPFYMNMKELRDKFGDLG